MSFNDGLFNMYREVDELSLLNKLFATLISERLNLDNYLTNIIITSNYQLKENISNMSFIISDAIENTKTLIKIKNGYPIFKLDDIELISIIKTKVSIAYKENIVLENIKEEINTLINLIKEILTKLNDNKNYEIITILANISLDLKRLLLDLS